ncbi:DMT family transporter [Effusibacillus dendaii]|uniref:Transporter n=1 Tax=Effusibacillus dendaii TaxID=2743772 RepID=A0A7I8DDA2_9BACL|nr:DMT family transporter [Effusibacillus dendaii]BCJ85871.1 transporter [Effusibacillus dendaii]
MGLIYYMLLMSTSVLWAGNFVAGKFLVGHASSLTLTDMRWVFGVLLLVPIVWGREKKLLPPKQAWLPLVCMGLTGVALFNLFLFLALERTSAVNVGLLSALNPVAIAIASFFLLREKLSGSQLAGMAVSLFGVLVVISHGEPERLLQLRFNTGDLFMLAAVGLWGLYSAAGRKAMRYVTPYMSTLWMGIFGVLALLPFDLANFHLENLNTSFWLATLYVSVGGTVLAMVFWNIGVQQVGGTKSGMFLNFNPVFTVILSYLFLRESVTTVFLIGTVLVIAGVYLFTAVKRSASQTADGNVIPAVQAVEQNAEQKNVSR